MLKIVDRGKNNIVRGADSDDIDLSVQFLGNNCVLDIGIESQLKGEIRFRTDDQQVVFGGKNRMQVFVALSAVKTKLTVGPRSSSNGVVWMNLGEAGDEVTIGEDCLFASVKFRTSDSHPLFDAATGERFNPSAPIVVGDRVWMAEEVLVLKGAKIGNGTAVGARALVIGELPENCVAVGMPARAVRHNIRWAEKF